MVLGSPGLSGCCCLCLIRVSYTWNHKVRRDQQAELLNGDFAAKIGRGMFSKDLMDRWCNCSLPSKVNGKCVYEGKCRSTCLIYDVTCSICDSIYIGNAQNYSRKRMDGHLSDIQRLLKNGQKSDLFASHFVQHFNNTTSRTDMRKCITFLHT